MKDHIETPDSMTGLTTALHRMDITQAEIEIIHQAVEHKHFVVILYLSRLRIPRLECVDFAGGLGAKTQDESAISSLCNKVNCAARENALGCNALR